MSSRIANKDLRNKIVSAEEAASLITNGMRLGMSGFTGSGYPKAIPQALADRMDAEHKAGRPFKVGLFTGASTGPELDGVLAKADGIEFRFPYNSDPTTRDKINHGEMRYIDMHLSHVEQTVWEGFYGNLDTAIVEVAGITEEGDLIPSTSVGNNKTWLDLADKVILEVNSWQSLGLDGMHDIYYGSALPPNRVPIPMTRPDDRIGQPHFRCDPKKVVAVIETDEPDRNSPFAKPDATAEAIAAHLLDFLKHEVKVGRLPKDLLPLQSGVGNVANAVLAGLMDAPFENLTSYTEVIQDGMIDLLEEGKLRMASATSFSLSPKVAQYMNENASKFRDKIILRPAEISNHPEVIRRLGCISTNGLIEADIYGNVNSSHVMGSRIQNGIGGSGDFARNAFISIFVTPSVAKRGDISCIVPQVSHVDHIGQDVQVIVTEHGLADLRGMTPKQRAELIIEKCAHPIYRDVLRDYYQRAKRAAYGLQTPSILSEALTWHQRFVETGSMRLQGTA